MTSIPRVSVIMAVYNGERFLREAVDSILAQTMRDFEFIIVDDASTDLTANILASYKDTRIRVMQNERNLGPGPSRNIAIRTARAPFIAIQDADDTCSPSRLEKQLLFLDENRAVILVGCQGIRINERTEPISQVNLPLRDVDLKWRLLFGNPFLHSSATVRRTALDIAGLYSEDGLSARYAEDYDLLSRLCPIGRLANIPERAYCYRLNQQSVCSTCTSDMDRHVERISRRNVSFMLGASNFFPSVWLRVRKFLCAQPGTRVDFERHEIDQILTFLKRLQEVFYSSYDFSSTDIERHSARLQRLWARHAVALACNRNGKRDLACRFNLLASAAKLFAGSMFDISVPWWIPS